MQALSAFSRSFAEPLKLPSDLTQHAQALGAQPLCLAHEFGIALRDRQKGAISAKAERAHPRATSVVARASHVVMISHSDAVAKVIEDAANAR